MKHQTGFVQIRKLGYTLVKYIHNEAKVKSLFSSGAISSEHKRYFNNLARLVAGSDDDQKDECYFELMKVAAKRVPFSNDRQAVIPALCQNIIAGEWCLPIAAFNGDPFIIYLLLRMLQDFNLLPKVQEVAKLGDKLIEERKRKEDKDIEKIRKLVEEQTRISNIIAKRKHYEKIISDYETSIPEEVFEEYGISVSDSNFTKFSQMLGFISPTVETLVRDFSAGDGDIMNTLFNLQSDGALVQRALNEVTQKVEALKSDDPDTMIDRLISFMTPHTPEDYRDSLINASAQLKAGFKESDNPQSFLQDQFSNYGIDMGAWQSIFSGVAVPDEIKRASEALFNEVEKKD